MTSVAITVLSTVNAPYGTKLSAELLASKLADPASADHCDVSAFAFFSDLEEALQLLFLDEMHISLADASIVAQKFSDMAGYQLPLARASYWHSRKALRGGIFEDQEELPLAEFGKWCRSAAVSEVARKKGEQD